MFTNADMCVGLKRDIGRMLFDALLTRDMRISLAFLVFPAFLLNV